MQNFLIDKDIFPPNMHQSPYLFKRTHFARYSFTSIGRRRIEKVVDFADLGINNTFNLAFGDLQKDGTFDDRANSNNGDIVKILTTVISILRDFLQDHPGAAVAFAGSTDERMKLYTRILKSYYSIFSKEFRITAFVGVGEGIEEVRFDPRVTHAYVVFLIKRID